MAKQTFTTGQVLTAAQMTSLQQTAMLGGAASAKTASYTLVAADAGTAITMSNASATTITVNTALFAAGDTVQITNLGAGVCTITAGTATVNTSASLALAQYESGTLDFTSTSAAIFIKSASAGGSGMSFISRTSFSNVASQAIDSVFSSTYFNYLVVIEGIYAATAADDLQMQMRYGSTTQTSGYNGNLISAVRDNTTITNTNQNAASQFTLGLVSGDSTESNAYQMVFTRVGNSSQEPLWSGTGTLGASSYGSAFFAGSVHTPQTYTGFLLKSSSSNITGIVSVYGLAKS